MVNYAELRERAQAQNIINPIDIFRRLPKSERIKDLFDIQRRALDEWFRRRNERDIVIKLNTGGGKTLVGLLIAQSLMRERRGPVLYLCPNWQLARQTVEKAAAVGIHAHAYERRVDEPEFLNGQSVLVAPYQALFNGRSKFGLRGQPQIVALQGLILDDAHAALPIMRQQFTLTVNAQEQPDLYRDLIGVFRRDFERIRKVGLLDDIVNGRERSVLEVPYQGWKNQLDAVRQLVQSAARKQARQNDEWRDHVFTWPLIRDELDVCHALISTQGFSITPMYPIVDRFPSFADCPNRVYMSATLPDDSAIIRTFGASQQHVADPIMPLEATNVGERMMLLPPLTDIEPEASLLEAVKTAIIGVSKHYGAAILVPSFQAGDDWTPIAELADTSEKATDFLGRLQNGQSTGPYIFANRYDGMDLPGDSCRLLVLAGLPKGIDSYDTYLSSVLGESGSIKTMIAQRIEQGAGRATRGAGDFSVVLFVGAELASWIGTTKNRELFTQVTRAQLEIGLQISKAIEDTTSFFETIHQCLNQDIDWRMHHAEALADLAEEVVVDRTALQIASSERNYFRLLRNGRFAQAVTELEDVVNRNVVDDRKYIGWLLQLAARAVHLSGDVAKATQLQQRAFGANPVLLPPDHIEYVPLTPPDEQAVAIVEKLLDYDPPKAYRAKFEGIRSHLTPEVSARQFEEALKELGHVLGFESHRPERDIGRGPDVLWLTHDGVGFVIEAKSRKKVENPLTKTEHAQLLESHAWFQERYKQREALKIVVHPNAFAAAEVTPGDTLVLTLDALSVIEGLVRELLSDLIEFAHVEREVLLMRCNAKLEELQLKPDQLVRKFLQPLESVR